MASTIQRTLVPILTVAVMLATAGQASATLTPHQRATRADAFIAAQQLPDGSIPAFSAVGSTADAVLAFVASDAGADPMNAALGYLRAQVAAGNVKGLGLRAKVVIAWTAAGRSPRTIGGKNLLRPIRKAMQNPSTVFDVALGAIALDASGITPPNAAMLFLADNECPDGGWPFDAYNSSTEDEHCVNIADPANDFFGSDTNTTAYVLMALAATPGAVIPSTGTTPFDFFDAIRDDTNGGWGYTWGFQTTDANSTGLVLQAYAAAGMSLPSGSRLALTGLQYAKCGAFAFTYTSPGVRGDPDVGATIGAVPGLLATPIPMTGDVTDPLPSVSACP